MGTSLMGSFIMLALLLLMIGFLFSLSNSQNTYESFSVDENGSIITNNPENEANFLELMKKLGDINGIILPHDMSSRAKRTISRSIMSKVPWSFVANYKSPTIRGKKTTVSLPWQMALNSPMLRG